MRDEWIEYHRRLAVRDARRAYVQRQLAYSNAPYQAVVRRSARKGHGQPNVHLSMPDQAWLKYKDVS